VVEVEEVEVDVVDVDDVDDADASPPRQEESPSPTVSCKNELGRRS
jgi:hypothetical protein